MRYRTDTVKLSTDGPKISGEPPCIRFLREEVLGSIDLYSYTSADDKLHFFINTGTGPIELIYRQYRSEQAGYGYQTVTEEKFRGQLKYVLRDCPTVARRADEVPYTRRAMVDLLREYHACIAEPVQVFYTRSRAERKLRIIPLVGLAYTQLDYRTERFSLQGLDFPAQTNLTLAIGLERSITDRSWPISAYLEFHYQRSDFQDEYTLISVGREVRVSQSARFAQVRGNLGLRTNLLPGSDVLFLSAGVSNIFFQDLELDQQADQQGLPAGPPFPSRGAGFGWHADLGVRLGSLRLLLRYDRDSGFSTVEEVETPMRYYRVLVGYAF